MSLSTNLSLTRVAVRLAVLATLTLSASKATQAQQYQYPQAQYRYPYQYAQTPYQYKYAPAAQPAAAPTYTYQSNYAQPATPAYSYPAAQPAATGGGDPYGFLGWLNSTRAQYGLPAVGYDANLTNWAAMNNAQQQSRGMGHYVMGPARRQNSATGGYGSIGAMWMASPAHRAALLDPTIRWIGIAGLGAYWTFNAN